MDKRGKVILVLSIIFTIIQVIAVAFLGLFIFDKLTIKDAVATNGSNLGTGIAAAVLIVFTIITLPVGVIFTIVTFLMNFIRVMKRKESINVKVNYVFAYVSLGMFILLLTLGVVFFFI